MRILHISKKYPNALGGDAVAVSSLERQQAKRGDHVTVLTSNCDEITADKRHLKFGLRDTPAALDKITPRRLLSLAALAAKSFRVIRAVKPEVVHTHSIDMAFAASFAARWFKVPLVHTFHILTFPDAHHSWLRRKTELLFLRGARPQVVTVPNNADLNHLRAAGVHNARLLPHGIDLDFWKRRETTTQGAFTFITAARLEDQKGNEYLVRAADALRRTTTDPFQILVVGDGSQRPMLEKLAADLGVSNMVHFLGRKSPEEVRDLYERSDAAVIPSLWESGPLTALEAWAMKLPLIITPVGVFANEPADSQRVKLVRLADADSLAAGMHDVMTQPMLRGELSLHGYEAARQHDWADMRDTTKMLYDEAIANNGGRAVAAVVAENIVVGGGEDTGPAKPQPAPRTFSFRQRTAVAVLSLASIAGLASAAALSPTLNTLVTLPLITFVPGMLLLLNFWPKLAKRPAGVAALSAALGVLLIAIESLLANWLLPMAGVSAPLQAAYLSPLHGVITALLAARYYQDRWRAEGRNEIRLRVGWLRSLRFAVPLLLPLLATLGAYRLNNGASNTLTLVSFGLIAVLAAWYVWKPRLWNASWLLFNIALGLLLATSLRSWFISGFDISQEFQVFMTTLQHNHWDINALPGNAYGACLSLTTLPAALQQMTGVGPEVIFKFFYQLMFAFTAVLTYLIGRHFVNKRLAFLAALLYAAQAQFIGTMPAIARQEIGLLFFGLILYLLLERAKMGRARQTLIVVLAGGMVLTHYSTTYVACMAFAVSAALLFAAQKLAKHWRRMPRLEPLVSASTLGRLALLLLVLATVWYGQINHTSGNVSNTLRSVSHLHMPRSLFPDTNTSKAQLLLGGDQDIIRSENVGKYANQQKLGDSIQPASVPTLQEHNHVLGKITDAGRFVLGMVMKVVLPLSPLLLLAYKKTRKNATDIAFVGLGAVAIFAAVTILPALSANYNLQRVFQQGLLALAVTGIWALWLLIPAGRRLKLFAASVFVIGYLLLSPGSGLLNQLAGTSTPRLAYNTTGEEYSKYYTRQSEVLGADWLAQNCPNESYWADRYATLRLTAYGVIPYDSIRSDILSAKTGCLYLDYANTHENLYYATYKKLPVRYTTPESSFANYNLIYTNGESRVYTY